jgi:uncharacterized lipoprotein YmbA
MSSFKIAPMLAVSLLATACGQSPPTRFLTLDPVPAATPIAATYRGPAIRISSVQIPPALDRVEFTRQTAPGEMKVDDLVHWSAPLGMLARNTLIIDLGQRLPPGSVTPPDAAAASGGLRIDVSILSFDARGSQASIEAAYEFVYSDQRHAGQQDWIRLTVPSTGQRPADAARAFSALLGALADRMATDLAAR